MVSGWKAIEQYLKEVEREAKLGLDQQVPQMFNEMANTTQNEPCNLSQTDYFSEDIFTRPSPVPVSESVQAPVCNDVSDIYDLDQEFIQPQESVEESFYQNEDSDYGIKRRREETIYQCKNVRDEQIFIKQEECYDLDSQPLPNEDVDHFWNMQSKILGECVQDVRDTCRYLDICPDPTQWSCAQVQQWIARQCHQFNIPQPSMEKFYMSGAQLCNLSEEHFRMYAREAGSTLHSRLYIWRCVLEQTAGNDSANNAILLTQIPIPTSPSLPPSTGSASPSPSVYSEDSQPSFPLKQFEQTIRKTAMEDGDRLPEEPVNHKQTIQLWQFLKLLLHDGNYNDCIRWVDRARGIFKIENSTRVAKLWGKRKNRPAMNYDKLSRSIRQYYKKNIIKKTEHSKRLVYQFCHL